MDKFQLTDAKVFLESLKPDVKKDSTGSARPILYLRLSTNQKSEILRDFSQDLEARYFDLDGPELDIGGGPRLRDEHEVFPHKRVESMSGAAVRIDYTVGKMHFTDATLDDFALHPHPGGVVIVHFTLGIWADETQAGKLYLMQKQEFRLSISPAQKTSPPGFK